MSMLALVALMIIGPDQESARLCEDAVTTLEMVGCLKDELRAAEDRLAEIRGSVKEHTTAEEWKFFEEAHDAWKTYREANCRSSSILYRGGTMEGIVMGTCKVRMTRARVQELEDIFKDQLCGGESTPVSSDSGP